MFRLAKLGFLPILFLDLKYDVPLCALCIFGTARRLKLITKGNKSGYISRIEGKKRWLIRKWTDDKPGAAVSVDHLQSAQSGLVPQFSGKLISECI